MYLSQAENPGCSEEFSPVYFFHAENSSRVVMCIWTIAEVCSDQVVVCMYVCVSKLLRVVFAKCDNVFVEQDQKIRQRGCNNVTRKFFGLNTAYSRQTKIKEQMKHSSLDDSSAFTTE